MDDLHWGHYLAIYYTFYLFLEWRVGEYIKFDFPPQQNKDYKKKSLVELLNRSNPSAIAL